MTADPSASQTPRPSICVVTDETAQLLRALCDRNAGRDQPVDLHLLLPAQDAGAEADLREACAGKATLHFCPRLADLRDVISWALATGNVFPPDFGRPFQASWLVHHGLRMAERRLGRPFDLVELPESGGWGVAPIAARRAGIAHAGTRFALRLGASHSLLTRAEPYSHAPSPALGALLDMEREALHHADLVVTPLPAMLTQRRDHYRFGPEWQARAVTEFPSVTPDPFRPNPKVALGDAPDYIFASPLRPASRPDLFLRAAILFLDRNPDFPGLFRLLSASPDHGFVDGLKALVPEIFADRILFIEATSPEQRSEYLARSVVVLPSASTGPGRLAYEAGRMGLRVLLNRACPAFGAGDHWRDQDNCLLFDPDFTDLARAIDAARHWAPLSMVSAEPDLPYWENPAPPPADAPAPEVAIPLLLWGFATAEAVHRKRQELQRAIATGQPVHFLLPRHAFAEAEALADSLRAAGAHAALFSGKSLAPSELQHYIASLGVRQVALCPATCALYPDFLRLARRAFQHDPALSLFSAHTRVLDQLTFQALGVILATGEAASAALLESAVSAPACALSTAALASLDFDDRAGELWFAAFTRRLALSRARILIAPAVLVDHFADRPAAANSRQLTAGIADVHGRDHGLTARLLALDTAQSQAGSDRIQRLGAEALRQADRIHPADAPPGTEPVRSHPDGVELAPIVGRVVVAELKRAFDGHPRTILCAVRNAGSLGNDVEVATLALDHALAPSEIAEIEAGRHDLPGASALDWHALAALQEIQLKLSLGNLRARHLYFLARVPTGLIADHSAPVWKWVELAY